MLMNSCFCSVKKQLQSLLGRSKKKSEPIKISSSHPLNFVRNTRFDVVIKYLFAKSILQNLKTDFYEQMYKEHLQCWNNFKEYNNPSKNSYEAFKEEFLQIIQSIKLHGFNEEISTIPVQDGKYPLNGAHRLAAALACNQDVICSEGIDGKDGQLDCGYEMFQQLGLSKIYMDRTAIEYCKLKPNTFVVCLFPACNSRLKDVFKILQSHGRIFYKKEVFLSQHGAFNLMRELYAGEAWAGTWKNNYHGYREKANLCFPVAEVMYAVLIEFDDPEIPHVVKKDVRSLFNVGNHCIHINDTHQESMRISKLFFNENSIHHLNHMKTQNFKKFDSYLDKFYNQIDLDERDIDDYCITASSSLSAYGLREGEDLDYLHSFEELSKNYGKKINSHNKYAEDLYPIHIDDIIHNPQNHFYHKGIKFASLEVVKALKEKRGEKKDLIDMTLIDSVL